MIRPGFVPSHHSSRRRLAVAGFVVLGLALWQEAAVAQTNLVTNGNFAVTGTSTSFQFGTWGPYTPPGTLSGWSSTGYNYVFLPTSLTATGYYGAGNVSVWGPSNGASNGFTGAAPGNNNYLALDADYPSKDGAGNQATAPVTQTLNGLKVGFDYTVSFVWAAAQQYSFSGATNETLTVSFGSKSVVTPTYHLPSQGFSGWLSQSYSFVASNTSQVLSFLAGGSPAVPPFVLLANVSVVSTPEPGTMTVLATAIGGLAAIRRRRRSARASASRT